MPDESPVSNTVISEKIKKLKQASDSSLETLRYSYYNYIPGVKFFKIPIKQIKSSLRSSSSNVCTGVCLPEGSRDNTDVGFEDAPDIIELLPDGIGEDLPPIGVATV